MFEKVNAHEKISVGVLMTILFHVESTKAPTSIQILQSQRSVPTISRMLACNFYDNRLKPKEVVHPSSLAEPKMGTLIRFTYRDFVHFIGKHLIKSAILGPASYWGRYMINKAVLWRIELILTHIYIYIYINL